MDFAAPESWITGFTGRGCSKNRLGFVGQVGLVGVGPVLGGGNSNIFGIFTPKIGEDEPILTND